MSENFQEKKSAVELDWTWARFEQLSTHQLYALLQLRVDVFVVEQACVYRELDGLDTLDGTVHILGQSGNDLLCYSRVLAPIAKSSPVRIGRVVVHSDFRRRGYAGQIMLQAIAAASEYWPECDLMLSAQLEAVSLYSAIGFQIVSETYFEDGIPHIDMCRTYYDS